MSCTSPQLDKKAPRAEPEEDIDVLRPGAEDALLESQTFSTADAPELTEDSARNTHGAESLVEEKMADLKQVVQILEAFKHQEDSDEFIDPIADVSTPPPSFAAMEMGGGSCLQDEVAEWSSDQETVKDPKEKLSSDSQDVLEQPEIPPLLGKELIATLGEVAGNKVTKGKNSSQLSDSETVTTIPAAEVSQHSPSTENCTDDMCSPKFADSSEETEQDTKGVPPPVVSSDRQQNELFSQSQCEPAHRGSNQEATQQVCSQSTPPLSTVAMELSNQGGAGSQGSGCVLALTERHKRAVERREGKSEQTGGEEGQEDGALDREKVGRQQDSEGLFESAERENQFVSSRDIRMESDSSDDSQSDSGVSTDLSPCNTLEGNASISAGTLATPPKETPIEREIRRSIEREHSLRRSRGLSSPPTAPEYVEIPLRKSVLSPPIISRSEKYQGKDRQYAGKKMQLEIHEEVQREQDLVKLGKIPGVYDKGTTQELKDRKEIFEAFQKPKDSSLAVTKVKASDQSSPDTDQDVMQEKKYASPPQILYQHKPDPELITEVDFPDASSRGGGHHGIKRREQEQGAAGVESSPRENPFFKLRSSNTVLRVEQDIREAQDREQELYRQRISLYGSKEGPKEGVGGGPEDGKEDGEEKKSFTLSPLKPPTEAHQSVGKLGRWPPDLPEDVAKYQEGFSPRTPRQKTPLVQRWESGLINGHEDGDDCDD
ncbi:hypothetical protein D4764_06G0000630 [Takifugu flavidus]|uniref:Mitotic interactor and substrate of PLK1 n=1 Tax=Takifugu flavidus TaxID=433684 RepID=A0A5C6MU90_9TELE|nr:hypothetical protein D4764_06G0000630 [Takifugu flavidus]